MDWLQRFYYKLWNRIGGKPWTGIWRSIWVRYEYIPMTIFFFAGVGLGIKVGWFWAGIIWLGYTVGYIMGHCHWQDKFLYKEMDE